MREAITLHLTYHEHGCAYLNEWDNRNTEQNPVEATNLESVVLLLQGRIDQQDIYINELEEKLKPKNEGPKIDICEETLLMNIFEREDWYKRQNKKLREALSQIGLMTCCDYNENEYVVSVHGIAKEAIRAL